MEYWVHNFLLAEFLVQLRFLIEEAISALVHDPLGVEFFDLHGMQGFGLDFALGELFGEVQDVDGACVVGKEEGGAFGGLSLGLEGFELGVLDVVLRTSLGGEI